MTDKPTQQPIPLRSAGVNVYCSNVQHSHDWYKNILGLEMKYLPAHNVSEYSERIDPERSLVFFYLCPGLKEWGKAASVSLCFQTADLAARAEELRAAGVKFARELSWEEGADHPSIEILDPDGHGIVIYQA